MTEPGARRVELYQDDWMPTNCWALRLLPEPAPSEVNDLDDEA